jgi:hypothetical protein
LANQFLRWLADSRGKPAPARRNWGEAIEE